MKYPANGKGGIRTHGKPLKTCNRLATDPFKPLMHLSKSVRGARTSTACPVHTASIPVPKEGVGFEPTARLRRISGFQGRPIKPLSHPSKWNGQDSNLYPPVCKTGVFPLNYRPFFKGRICPMIMAPKSPCLLDI